MNFYDEVYEVVKNVPKGHVITYGQIARIVGNPKASRAVGYALHVNPDPKNIHCFRVVDRFGRPAKSFAFGGLDAQRKLLEEDGVEFLEDGSIDLEKYGINL